MLSPCRRRAAIAPVSDRLLRWRSQLAIRTAVERQVTVVARRSEQRLSLLRDNLSLHEQVRELN